MVQGDGQFGVIGIQYFFGIGFGSFMVSAVMQKKTHQNIDAGRFVAWSAFLLKNLAEMPPYYSDFKAFVHAYKFKETVLSLDTGFTRNYDEGRHTKIISRPTISCFPLHPIWMIAWNTKRKCWRRRIDRTQR